MGADFCCLVEISETVSFHEHLTPFFEQLLVLYALLLLLKTLSKLIWFARRMQRIPFITRYRSLPIHRRINILLLQPSRAPLPRTPQIHLLIPTQHITPILPLLPRLTVQVLLPPVRIRVSTAPRHKRVRLFCSVLIGKGFLAGWLAHRRELVIVY